MRDVLSWVAAGVCGALEHRTTTSEPGSTLAEQGASVVAALTTDHALVRNDEQQLRPPQPSEERSRIFTLAESLGLDPTDAALLAVVVAPDLDANIARAFDLLGGGSHGAASVAVALEVCEIPTAGPEGVERLGISGALCVHRLVSTSGDGSFLRRTLRCPERVLAFLSGSDVPPPEITAMASYSPALPSEQARQAATALAHGVGLVWMRSPLGSAGSSVAAEAFRTLALDWMVLDLRHRPATSTPMAAAEAAVLEALLSGAGLVLEGAEALGQATPDQEGQASAGGRCAPLLRGAVPVIAVSRQAWQQDWSVGAHAQPLQLEAPVLTPAERAQLWAVEVPELFGEGAEPPTEDMARELSGLSTLRLTPKDVAAVARYAAQLATVRATSMSTTLLREAARSFSAAGSAGAGAMTRASAGTATLDDLVLPPREAGELRRLVDWARHRDQVLQRGAVHGKAGHGRGISALFTGSPGTGKTLAAHIVAEAIGLDLFQVDLSGVVDKYIGETEKNLERIFHHAESRNLLLFFDEADALFGNRSEVKDAHDRYANQEVAYLLQRMEQYDGITVLATNLRGNLDAAFTRRLQFLINFPNPDEETRARLWDRLLGEAGELDPDDPVHVPVLVHGIDIAGGDIRNIVLAATYDAVCVSEPLGMRHLREATARELQKLGKRLPASFTVGAGG